jgi:hypothetical protein
VNFCDATAPLCSDIHLLGVAQLTQAGTASIKLRPGLGDHKYKAQFAGTRGFAASASNVSAFTVIGVHPTSVALSSSGIPGNYTLSATVTTSGTLPAAETVSFLDTSSGDQVLGSAELGSPASALSFSDPGDAATGSSPRSLVTGDFNGDGVPDLVVPNGSDKFRLRYWSATATARSKLPLFPGAVTYLAKQ